MRDDNATHANAYMRNDDARIHDDDAPLVDNRLLSVMLPTVNVILHEGTMAAIYYNDNPVVIIQADGATSIDADDTTMQSLQFCKKTLLVTTLCVYGATTLFVD